MSRISVAPWPASRVRPHRPRSTPWLTFAIALSASSCGGDSDSPQPTGTQNQPAQVDAGAGAVAETSGASPRDGAVSNVRPDAGRAAAAGTGDAGVDSPDSVDARDGGGPDTASNPGSTDTKLVALSSGVVEAFINGKSVGKTSAGGTLLSVMPKLADGPNVVALRVTGAAPAGAYAVAQLEGAFGRLLSSEAWRVKTASGDEATSATPAFAGLAFDDSAWSTAVSVATKVSAPFPTDSAATPIWSSASADKLLLRLHVYLPAGLRVDQPVGFGRAVTGGHGGSTVRVKDITELAHELCHTKNGTTCTDAAPRIIEVPSQVFDFTGAEGMGQEAGCTVKDCTGGVASEYILNRQNWCGARPLMTVQYDTAGTTPLWVGSNKTLIGIGPAATLKGKGLTLRGGVENIIIRNLTITSINAQVVWGGDALTIDGADRVWVDHNRFSLIGRQMIVTGFGKASNVTFSFNELDGRTPYSATCNGAHYWALLLLGSADTLTFYGNWLHDISGRAPHAGGLMAATNTIQMVNNYYQHFPGHALEPNTDMTHMLLESNYFEKVDQFIDPQSGTGHVFAAVGSPNTSCQSALGRACTPNAFSPAVSTAPPLDKGTFSSFGKDAVPSLVTPYDAEQVPYSIPYLAGPNL